MINIDIEKEKELRDKLITLLEELSKNQKILSDKDSRINVYRQLESIYTDKIGEKTFRHFYSDIFSTMTLINDELNKGSIDVLAENMRIIHQGYKPRNTDSNGNLIDVSDSINKLYDHISLDCARIRYAESMYRNMSKMSDLEMLTAELINVKSDLDNSKNKLNKAKKDIYKARNEIKKTQREYVTILGIFASIVLAFTGGIAFSTSVLRYVHLASIFRLSAVVIGLGIVLFNVIYILVRFIIEINDKGTKWCLKEFPAFWVVNGGLAVALIAVIIAYFRL